MDGDSAKTRFLTAISHDMRQPLQALTLYLTALDRRVQDENARAVLAKADSAAQVLVAMFDELVDLARIDAGKLSPHIEPTPLQDVFDALRQHAPSAEIEPSPLHVLSDGPLLERALRHLISNALKHGGGVAKVSAHEANGAIEIAVSDRGPGIAPDDHARIFDEFVRLDGAPADGLGLGLTVARGIATALGHEIRVESSSGAGATFLVRAPRG
jgi:signal transduction histidine kinase